MDTSVAINCMLLHYTDRSTFKRYTWWLALRYTVYESYFVETKTINYKWSIWMIMLKDLLRLKWSTTNKVCESRIGNVKWFCGSKTRTWNACLARGVMRLSGNICDKHYMSQLMYILFARLQMRKCDKNLS